ncbi:MAG: hypothetical protein DRQ88_11660 [Epsilonproteobacteria bacterium]|nr:MAG: hypothetical protein DRQ89_08085 [Campylobacterota bacterium]RLA64042.1 MAG: hypothetical protein DRQ88_11660 [Campylobacterota bacterium]
MQDFVLAKIGGSSLRGPACLDKCRNLLAQSPDIRAIVISATFNTTNLLEELAEKSLARDFKAVVEVLKKLKSKHLEFAHAHDINFPVDELVLKAQTYAQRFSQTGTRCPQAMDSLYAIGELLSANLFAAYLQKTFPEKKVHFFDARDVIITDSNFGSALPLHEEIKLRAEEILRPLLSKNSIVVIPGFIGRDLKGETTTLGREGSDLSAALLASALDVSGLHIYKDVAGIYSADPKLVPNAHALKQMDYESINTLSEFGAKVIFPRALTPVMEKEIDVFIGSTENPEEGTRIIKESLDAKFSGISLRSEFYRIDLEKIDNEISSENFKDNILKILAEEKITPQNIFYPRESVCLILSSKEGLTTELRDHLREFCKVSQENRVSMITIVGTKIKTGKDLISKALKTLQDDEISLSQVDEGANFLTFAFPSRFEEKVLNQLHHILFS